METVKQDNPNQGANAPEQTFTQAQVNAIVAERLSRDRARYADYETLKEKAAAYDAAEEASKSELQKAQDAAAKAQAELDALKRANAVRAMREQAAKDAGLSTDMIEFLTGSDAEACAAQAKKLAERIKPTGFPNVKDAGETRTPGVTKADILSIKNEKERLKAIREHIDLFEE